MNDGRHVDMEGAELNREGAQFFESRESTRQLSAASYVGNEKEANVLSAEVFRSLPCLCCSGKNNSDRSSDNEMPTAQNCSTQNHEGKGAPENVSLCKPCKGKQKKLETCILKNFGKDQEQLAEGNVSKSVFTQTDSAEAFVDAFDTGIPNHSQEEKCWNGTDLKQLGKRYLKLRSLLMRYYARMIEVKKENETLKSTYCTLRGQFISEKEKMQADMQRFRSNFHFISKEMTEYHKALLKAYDEFDAKNKIEKERISEVVDGYSKSNNRMEAIIKAKIAEVEVLRNIIDKLKRELAVQNRENYLARQRAADAEKKLSDALYIACKTKCPSCKVFEKNKDFLYAQIAEKTVFIEKMSKELKELKAKHGTSECLIEKLRKEKACLDFEKKSWEKEASRLQDELRLLKSQNNSLSAAATPCTSLNSASSDETGTTAATASTDVIEKPSASPGAMSSDEKTKVAGHVTICPLSNDVSVLEIAHPFSGWLKAHQNLRRKFNKDAEKACGAKALDGFNSEGINPNIVENKKGRRNYVTPAGIDYRTIEKRANETDAVQKKHQSGTLCGSFEPGVFVDICAEEKQGSAKKRHAISQDDLYLCKNEKRKKIPSSVSPQTKKDYVSSEAPDSSGKNELFKPGTGNDERITAMEKNGCCEVPTESASKKSSKVSICDRRCSFGSHSNSKKKIICQEIECTSSSANVKCDLLTFSDEDLLTKHYIPASESVTKSSGSPDSSPKKAANKFTGVDEFVRSCDKKSSTATLCISDIRLKKEYTPPVDSVKAYASAKRRVREKQLWEKRRDRNPPRSAFSNKEFSMSRFVHGIDSRSLKKVRDHKYSGLRKPLEFENSVGNHSYVHSVHDVAGSNRLPSLLEGLSSNFLGSVPERFSEELMRIPVGNQLQSPSEESFCSRSAHGLVSSVIRDDWDLDSARRPNSNEIQRYTRGFESFDDRWSRRGSSPIHHLMNSSGFENRPFEESSWRQPTWQDDPFQRVRYRSTEDDCRDMTFQEYSQW